ncbi:MAG: alcohol dehydrogenase catalytic domain-containing protein [Thaumarchaeota archaeon]|nr:alcohol dehydrogenase catalytic domain-containing protein [Nitrososphaerota archaeon]
MKAIILKGQDVRGNGTAELTEMAVPSVGPGELLVEMQACGLCGTDVEKLRGHYTAAMPVLGHEAVGTVVSVGEGVAGLKNGDRVFPHHHVPCRDCFYCKRGSETMCDRYRTSNIDPGGFSEYFRVPRWNVDGGGVLRLPPGVGFEDASMIEPVACCMRALARCAVGPDDSVLVAGAGPVGMMHALLLKQMRSKVIVSDVSEPRLKFAEKAGVGTVVNAAKEDVTSVVKEQTGGRGADMAVVASGNPRAVIQGLRAVRKGGRVCVFGAVVKGSVLDYDFSDLFNSEISVITNYGATETETTKALDLIARKEIDFGSLITHRFHLSDFDEAVARSEVGDAMKVLVIP